MFVWVSNSVSFAAKVAMCFVLVGIASISSAAELYRWVDENGNVTYQDTPPPSNIEYESQTYEDPPTADNNLQYAIEEAARETPVVLYSADVCGPCDEMRNYLEKRSLPFSERNIQNSEGFQAELELKVGGLTVPTLLIGEKVISGFHVAR